MKGKARVVYFGERFVLRGVIFRIIGSMNPEPSLQAPFRPLSRTSAFNIAGGKTEWLKMQNKIDLTPSYLPQFRPQMRSNTGGLCYDQNRSKSFAHELENTPMCPQPRYIAPAAVTDNAVSKSAPYMSFTEPNRTDEFYNRYQRLSHNVAYRYPNPGAPREREGRIGGSWRHIKEVLGHGGSRVVFVDGLVRLYDLDKSKMRGGRPAPMRASLTLPAHRKEDREQIRMHEAHQQRCQPWVEGPQLPEVGKPHDLPGSPAKYKGFYTLRN